MLDPLQHLDRFAPHAGPVLDLPNVTSITADDRTDGQTVGRLASVTRWHRRFLRLGREVILSGSRPDVDGIDWVKLGKWNEHYRIAYSRWCQAELPDHFSTPYVMIWQLDGFALDPQYWSSEFLGYDYIGKPEFFGVGNGGFSLRSKRFCEEARRLPRLNGTFEDWYFCVVKRSDLEGAGMQYAPAHVAARWSGGPSLNGCFGFHYNDDRFLRVVAEKLNRLITCSERIRLQSGAEWNGRTMIHPQQPH